MSYTSLGLDLKSLSSAVKPTTTIAIDLNKKYEAIAKELKDIDPTGSLETYFAIQAAVLAIADELGIRHEVETIYHSATAGSKVGMAAGTAAAQVASVVTTGSTALAGSAAVASAAAMGMVAGGLVGAVVGVLSLFDDDAEEKEAKRKARVAARKAMEAYMLSRLDIYGLIKEQQNVETNARAQAAMAASPILGGGSSPHGFGVASPMAKLNAERQKSLLEMATRAQKLAALFITVEDMLKPTEVEWFVVTANIARWEQLVARYEKELIPQTIGLISKFSKPPYTSSLSVGGPNFFADQMKGQLAHYIDLTNKMRMSVITEKAKLPKVPVLSVPPALFAAVLKPATKAPPVVTRTGAITKPLSTPARIGVILLAAGVLGGAGYGLWRWKKKRRRAA